MSSSNPTVTKAQGNWFVRFFSSTLGRKLLMSLTGIFLIAFLTVHLIGNLQLLFGDEGEAFNKYAQFMGHNELIQIVSKLNFFFIILHVIVSIVLTQANTAARPVRYQYSKASASSGWSSRNMMILGSLVFIFIVIHLQNFWYQSKFGSVPMVSYNGQEYQDLYTTVKFSFSEAWLVGLYVLAMIGLAFHLSHGFQSAFQTLGLNHKKYTPFIKTLGAAYSIIVPLLFATIPIVMFLQQL